MRVSVAHGLAICLALLAQTTVLSSTCPTATENVIEQELSYTLPAQMYGTDVVAAGAYVMTLFSSGSQLYSQFSFNQGAIFPAWTRRSLPSPPGSTALSLLSDGRQILAIGNVGSKMLHYKFDFGDFTWKNGSTIFPTAVNYMHCAAKRNLAVCALAGEPEVNDGAAIFSLDLTSAPTASPAVATWVRRVAEEMPVCNTRPTVATDGESFMVCLVGTYDIAGRLICASSVDGTEAYINAAYPTDTSLPASTQVRLASNGVKETYVLAYVDASRIQTRLTLDAGATWSIGEFLFAPSSILPDFLTYTTRFVALYQQSGVAYITFQNNTTPLQWTNTAAVLNGTKASLVTGQFATNYYLAYKDSVKGVVVSSCIPTAAPTFMPSPSPTKNAGAVGEASQTLIALLSLTLLLAAI